MRKRGWEGFPKENGNICDQRGVAQIPPPAGDAGTEPEPPEYRWPRESAGEYERLHTPTHMLIKEKAAKWTRGDGLLVSWFRALYKLQVLHNRSAMNFYYLFFKRWNVNFHKLHSSTPGQGHRTAWEFTKHRERKVDKKGNLCSESCHCFKNREFSTQNSKKVDQFSVKHSRLSLSAKVSFFQQTEFQ